jgi:hypothetical protein
MEREAANKNQASSDEEDLCDWTADLKTATKYLDDIENIPLAYEEAIETLLFSEQTWITFELKQQWVKSLKNVPYFIWDLKDKQIIAYTINLYKNVEHIENTIARGLIDREHFEMLEYFLGEDSLRKSKKITTLINHGKETKTLSVFPELLKYVTEPEQRLYCAALSNNPTLVCNYHKEIDNDTFLIDAINGANETGCLNVVKWALEEMEYKNVSIQLKIESLLYEALLGRHQNMIEYYFSKELSFSDEIWSIIIKFCKVEILVDYLTVVNVSSEILINSLCGMNNFTEHRVKKQSYLKKELIGRFNELEFYIQELRCKAI